MADRDWIIKHYRRGGLIAKFNDDCYFGFKLANSRSWVEWRLLQYMRSLQLPVPKPIAAQVNKNLLTYTADLITERLPDTQTLFHLLLTQALPADTWQAIGACIRRFHGHNIYHADLNANNILLTSDHKIYLIDFDRCRVKSDDNWQQGNLKRLLRSLNKLQTGNPDMHFAGSDWRNLLEGYGITSEREIDSLSGLKGHG